MVVYRDGVSEGAFKLVLERELPFIYTALNLHRECEHDGMER